MIEFILWWLLTQVLGLAGLPIAWRLFKNLPDRGYAFARPLGLLLSSYLLWLLVSFGFLRNERGTIAVLIVVLGAVAWLKVDRPALVGFLRDHRATIFATEALFFVTFAAWTFFRSYNPEIAGTEKPMELAFLSAILRTGTFPPPDPWLSGFAISYYYFGYLMVGLLTKLSGVTAPVAFNLAIPLLFAWTCTGAFSVVYNLTERRTTNDERRTTKDERRTTNDERRTTKDERRMTNDKRRTTDAQFIFRRWSLVVSRWSLVVGHWSSGLVGALFVAIAGNLEGLLEVLYTRGIGPAAFWQWLDIKDLNVPAVATGGWLPDRYWWWWRASRVVHDVILGQEAEVIDEFPFFSFMLGDMHPHVLALPFVLMAIGLALNLMLEARNWKLEPGSWKLEVGSWKLEVGSWKLEVGSWKGILLYAVALGALAFLNTWDFPIYVALVTLAFGSGLALSNGLTGAVLGRTVGAGATFGVLGFLFYLPFYLGFQSQAGGVLPNLLFPTRLSQYLVMFGPFLVISAVLLVMLSRATPARELRRGFLGALPGTLLLPPLFLGLVLFASVALPPVRAFVETLLDNPVVRASVGGRSVSQLAGLVVQVRVATPWTYLLLAGLIAWAAGLLWAWLARGWSVGQPFQAARIERLPSDIFAVLLIGLGLLLTFSVEFIYLKDSFGTRMNTVFKFYYQAWILLALASAYGLSRLAGRDTAFALRLPALTLAGLLVAASLIYPVGATWTKAGGFRGPATLDGLAFFKQARPADYDAIEWLKANVADQPIVLQATGGSYSDAGWIAAATGLPTVLGWGFHELQWRGTYDEPGKREPVIQQIYQSGDVQTVRKLLDEWQIEYVYIGPVERDRYKLSPPQIDKFGRFMGKVYDRAGVVIYRR